MMHRSLRHALGLLAVPAALVAQTHDHGAGHAHDAAHDHDAMHAAGSGLSQAALEQIETVRRSVEQFSAVGVAQESGFRPALGLIPTMGTHWVSRERMQTGTPGADLSRPEHLMFSPVEGEQRLVGIAFAYQGTPGQEQPDLFDGSLDAWHTHPELSPPGLELTMLHVWFVESPDGPFAGHNPWLPFWAVGLDAPDAARLADPEDSRRIRALGLALAETVDQGGEQGFLAGAFQAARAASAPHRERIRGLIPRLDAAHAAADLGAWNAAADEAVAAWEEIRRLNLESLPAPALRERLDAFYEEMLGGGHGDDHGGEHAH